MVLAAVSKTGVIRVLPASINADFNGIPWERRRSVNSTINIPFLTTIPIKATIPIPLIITEKSISKIANPNKTPITEKKTSLKIMIGLVIELN